MDSSSSQVQSSPQNTPKKSNNETTVGLVVSLIFAGLFWSQTGKTFESPCLGPSLFWANYAKYYYIVNSLFAAINLYFLQLKDLKDHPKQELFKSFDNVNIIIKLAGFPLMIGAVTSFMHSDECPDLSIINTFHFAAALIMWVIVAMGVGMGLCCTCCCLGLCGALLAFIGIGSQAGRISSSTSGSRDSQQQAPQTSTPNISQGYKLL